MTTTAGAVAPDTAAPPGAGVPFTVASRPQRRFSNTQTVSNLAAGGSFQVVQLPATGWVRRVSLFFTEVVTSGSAGAVVTGDGPWNLISGVTITDATGQPIIQPISGYNLYLVNKYFGAGSQSQNIPNLWDNPQMSPEFAFASTSTVGTATWRLDLDFEVDARTGYGCIPNLDSNASLQLKVDFAISTVAFTGTTTASAVLSMRVSTEYWAPVGSQVGGAMVDNSPPGAGDYLETRFETQVTSASSENLLTLTNRGGLVKGVLLICRGAATVRTAITPASNLGILLDNQPINEGVPIEEHYDQHRRMYGYMGADLTNSYAPLAAAIPGMDRGVVPLSFFGLSMGRDSWLNTRAGSLFQVKVTPGAGSVQVDIVTQLMQVKNPSDFYNAGQR